MFSFMCVYQAKGHIFAGKDSNFLLQSSQQCDSFMPSTVHATFFHIVEGAILIDALLITL